jgi:ParB family chromosome partitioning protein
MSYPGVLEEVSIAKIMHQKSQFRMNLDNLDELANSIKQHGLLQPIVIRPMQHEYEVVAGNRRLAAARLLKLRKISCHVIELSDKEAYEVGLVENVQHKTMNPVEEAIAFNQYVENHGWGGVSDLARRIGRSQEFVSKRMQLLRLPERVREQIIRQRITPSVALEMLPLETGAMEEFADFIIKNPLTKKEVRHIVKVSKTTQLYNDKDDRNKTKNNIAYEKELYLLDKALRKSIAVMKSTLVNFDDIITGVNDEWILKELLMQYRLIIHGDIDTFLKLRKRLRMKIPHEYFGSRDDEAKLVMNEPNGGDKQDNENGAIHLWATKGIWQ